MTKAGVVYATGTEDMDTLTFGTPILLRHLTFSEARKMPIKEVHLSKVLSELELTHEQVFFFSNLANFHFSFLKVCGFMYFVGL